MKKQVGIVGLALIAVFLFLGLMGELSAGPFCPEICLEELGCAYGSQLCGLVECSPGQWGSCWYG